MQILKSGRTYVQIKGKLSIKRRGDQKYLIFWSPKRAHTVGRERKRRKEEEEEDDEAKKRYGTK